MITSLEPVVTNLGDFNFKSLFVCSGQLVRFLFGASCIISCIKFFLVILRCFFLFVIIRCIFLYVS